MRGACRPRHHVEHFMDTVAKVHVGRARLVKKHLRSFGPFIPEGVACPVIRCPVRFRFCYANSGLYPAQRGDQFHPDQLAGDDYGVSSGKKL